MEESKRTRDENELYLDILNYLNVVAHTSSKFSSLSELKVVIDLKSRENVSFEKALMKLFNRQAVEIGLRRWL